MHESASKEQKPNVSGLCSKYLPAEFKHCFCVLVTLCVLGGGSFDDSGLFCPCLNVQKAFVCRAIIWELIQYKKFE